MADFILPYTSPASTAKKRLAAPIHTERHVKVICVGAGASGLLMAYKMDRHFQNFDLTIYEKNVEVSGTWFENRYPGCACDVPSHNYTWSFEPKLDWTGVYSSSREILQYFKDFASKYQLHRFIKKQHQVVGAQWDDKIGQWNVTIKNLQSGEEIRDTCDILINAGGILNNWRWPAIPGLEKYKGTLLHTANWDDRVQLEGKHVGLIGNGSSGIQVLPTIQPKVKKVTTFIREPTWVSPIQGLEQHVFSQKEKKEFSSSPGVLLDYRKAIEKGLNGQFALFLRDTTTNNDTHTYMLEQMKKKLQNPSLEKHLIPQWSVGCRRLTPGVGYLESLGKENVDVVYGEIVEVTEKGCLCDNGNEYPVDVLICATGFDTGFKPRFPLIGPAGNLQDEWSKVAESYLGMAAADVPNYLMFLGPNCPIGNGPVLIAIEAQADYFCKLIDRYQTNNIHSFAPKREAVKDFIEHKDQFMQSTVWQDPCRSWYKANTAEGKITALWPGSTLHYMEALDEVRFDDWNIKYQGNRFAWLGNGYSQTEVDQTADWGFYIREYDDGAPHSRLKRRKIENKSGTVQSNVGVNFSGRNTQDEAKL